MCQKKINLQLPITINLRKQLTYTFPMYVLLTQSRQEEANTKRQWRNNTMIWDELLATTFWQGIDPKAMTTFSDIASLSYHTPLSVYLNGKWGQSINFAIINLFPILRCKSYLQKNQCIGAKWITCRLNELKIFIHVYTHVCVYVILKLKFTFYFKDQEMSLGEGH